MPYIFLKFFNTVLCMSQETQCPSVNPGDDCCEQYSLSDVFKKILLQNSVPFLIIYRFSLSAKC